MVRSRGGLQICHVPDRDVLKLDERFPTNRRLQRRICREVRGGLSCAAAADAPRQTASPLPTRSFRLRPAVRVRRCPRHPVGATLVRGHFAGERSRLRQIFGEELIEQTRERLQQLGYRSAIRGGPHPFSVQFAEKIMKTATDDFFYGYATNS